MKILKKKGIGTKSKVVEEVEDFKIQLVRALADYDNLKKRVDAEKEVWFRLSSARVVNRFLPVLDNLESAQNHLKDQGLAIVIGEFRRVINDEAFEEVQISVGETEFDTETMEAVEVVESEEDDKNNKIAEIVLTGWRSKTESLGKQMIVRPAKVKVFKFKVEN